MASELSERIAEALAKNAKRPWYAENGAAMRQAEKVVIEGVLADTPIMKHELLRCELQESKAEIERLRGALRKLRDAAAYARPGLNAEIMRERMSVHIAEADKALEGGDAS